ncbi:SDR family oxidoreductase [Aureimonas sp. AU12]|uniref:SDR family oxidoreductase n=1 Tax=Aureimonas sp. AU12 TaxID=1638161 RepID=UPI000A63DC25|nr:SDR family oxidoreductase [Aureimonas sp. AU12]
MSRVLVLGGYGGFGARLSRRLAADGWQVIVAGRDAARAQRLAASLPEAEGIRADRDGDLAPCLAAHRPFLLVDAAGPFQTSDHRAVQACLTAGVHYLDLADARAFVCGIEGLDDAARAAGLVVISGASSLPALSGAAVADLARGMEAVHAVDLSISASNRATAGPSVAAAILGTVGRPVRLWRGGRWQTATGWQQARRETYALPGRPALRRLVALADAPDHEILPAGQPGRPATTFRAGPELPVQLAALWLMSWPVRWRWWRSLVPLAPRLARLQRLTARWGSDRSAMAVEVRGCRDGETLRRRWTLIANRGDGPEIPTLAAQLLARDLRAGLLAPGARHAGGLLSLDRFRVLFANLAIEEAVVSHPDPPLYRRLMGDRFDALSPPVRSMHEVAGFGAASGEAHVTRGRSPLARLVAGIVGFPPQGDHALHVTFEERDGRERWIRDFSGRRFSSEMSGAGDEVVERFGPLRFRFALVAGGDGSLEMALRGWSAFHVPMPLWLGPRSRPREWAENGGYAFDVPIALPLIGLVVRYRGRLRRTGDSAR